MGEGAPRQSLWTALVDLALPIECGGCGLPGLRWCDRCAEDFASELTQVRPRVDPGVPVWSLGTYVGARRHAVLAAKEQGRRDLGGPLGRALALGLRRLRDSGELDPAELAPLVLIPAPSRRAAARRRGGDPVERAVRSAAEALAPEQVAVAAVLELGRGVRDSVGLSAEERRRNLQGRVRLRPGPLRGGAPGPLRGRALGPLRGGALGPLRGGAPGPLRGRALGPLRGGALGPLRGGAPSPLRGGAGFSGATVVLIDDVVTTGATAAESVRALVSAGVRVHAALTMVHV